MLSSMTQNWWQWLRGWWTIGTLGEFSQLYDTISNIRARQCTRCARGMSRATRELLGPQERPTQPAAVKSLECSLDNPNNVLPQPCTPYCRCPRLSAACHSCLVVSVQTQGPL